MIVQELEELALASQNGYEAVVNNSRSPSLTHYGRKIGLNLRGRIKSLKEQYAWEEIICGDLGCDTGTAVNDMNKIRG